MKRIISVILTVLLVSALAFTFTASAEGEVSVSLGLPETFKAGENVQLTISLDKVPASPEFATINVVFKGITFETEGVELKNIEVKNADSAILDICIIDDEGMCSITLDGTKKEIASGTQIIVTGTVAEGATEITADVDTASSSIYAGADELPVNAASAKSTLKSEEAPVVTIDVDTTGWTVVDGKTVGTYQTALENNGTELGTYAYNVAVVDGKYVVEVVYTGVLSGTAESFGNGNGTNIRVWFHTAKNANGEDQLAYNAIVDIAYNGTGVSYRVMPNTVTSGNKADSATYAYDVEKPFMTVESVVPTAKDGLYVKAVFDSIPNVVDNKDLVAIISVSGSPNGAANNCIHSNTIVTVGEGDAAVTNNPWADAAWTTNTDSLAAFYTEQQGEEPSSEEPSSEEPSSEEPSSTEPSVEPSSEESSQTSPSTGDIGIAAIALLALVTAGGVVAVRKFR